METRVWRSYNKFNISLHVLSWIGFLSLPILFMNNNDVGISEMLGHWRFWFFALCFIVPYYLNSFFWTPYVIRSNRYLLFVISIILIGAVFAFWLRPFDRLMQLDQFSQREVIAQERRPPPTYEGQRPMPFPPKENRPPHLKKALPRLDIASVYIVLLIIILGSSFKVVQYWIRSQQKVLQVHHEWTKAELAFLKAQVHPHFLFNTLNNIYALALTNNPVTAISIYKLSQLMRYYMDERNNEKISLEEEAQAIQDFVSLQKLRIGTNCTLIENYEGLNIEKKIYPFILLPFVENAFKYGLRATESCNLHIYLQVTADYCLLEVKNSVAKDIQEQPSLGTGLKNTKRLLDHLYPDQYNLEIMQDNDEFFVKLLLYI